MKKILLLLICLSIANSAASQQTVGLFTQTTQSQDGYVLFAPMANTTTYLIDKCGYYVHSWPGTYKPGLSAYLLEDGSLLRTGSVGNSVFTAGGNGGIIERIDWNGNVTWSYTLSSLSDCQHHDIAYLPNGNILVISWDLKRASEALLAGRNPSLNSGDIWSEKIVELQPLGTDSANIVWEWYAWDHLVQDYDSNQSNFGVVADAPELININYHMTSGNSDWLHINAVDYNPEFDQILLSCHNFSEVWVIDHSTTTAEAASHNGGTHNKGGDLLYRWGNSAAYNIGTAADKKFFGQHNATWITSGLNDAGKIMVFNNGTGRPTGNYSSVDIIDPPVDSLGNYSNISGQPYLPSNISWTYVANPTSDFFSNNISGTQRLANGNTIICEGVTGRFFEVDATGNIVWEYINPVNSAGPITQGNTASQNTVFRCTLYQPDYAGFSGQTLVSSGTPIENNPISYTCTASTGIKGTPVTTDILLANPFSEDIHLFSDKEINGANILLMSANGAIIKSWENISINANIPNLLTTGEKLPEGLYILTVKANNTEQHFKLLCRH